MQPIAFCIGTNASVRGHDFMENIDLFTLLLIYRAETGIFRKKPGQYDALWVDPASSVVKSSAAMILTMHGSLDTGCFYPCPSGSILLSEIN